MIWRVDVFAKNKKSDLSLTAQVRDLGVYGDFKIFSHKVFFLDSELKKSDIESLAKQLLIDPVLETYSINQGIFSEKPEDNQIIVAYNPGVSDPVAISLMKAISDVSVDVRDVMVSVSYEFQGLEPDQISYIAPKILYNPLIQYPLKYSKLSSVKNLSEFSGNDYEFSLVNVDILNADDEQLKEISRTGCLSLSLEEMRIIKKYFTEKKRNPTDCELEQIAVLWSEHCAHKTFRGLIDYQECNDKGEVTSQETIPSLLKTTIMKATKEIASSGCVSVFDDNSGIVKFDDTNNICCKVETHNHPSSLEPYGGAATGIGGVIRDILGTGCGARPFASLDVFCFSPWDIEYKDLPVGLLHPKRIIRGVVSGVGDYGNRMGIPTVSGAVCFDKRFLGNPLVFCGTLGLIKKERSFKHPKTGNLIVLAGAKTGRDGVHGATFSSQELDETTVSLTSAVQIGNPIEEKKLTSAILRAAEENLFNAITDCGAGGLSSAVPELGQGLGIDVELDKVPLKYKRLNYTEIWISESQERMVFFTETANIARLTEIFQEEDVPMTVIGSVTDTNRIVLNYNGNRVADIDMDFVFELPRIKKEAVWVNRAKIKADIPEKKSYNDDLISLMAQENIAPKDWIVRQYDHEVQGGSVIKAITGIENISLSDSSVNRPDLKSQKGVALGVGINPFYSDIDPYWMAALSIDEALRNVVAVGADLTKTYILDNFSWGSPDDSHVLGGLVRAAKACYDYATYFKTPFISGKDSFYNEYTVGDKRIIIPGTLLVTSLSVIDDCSKTVTGYFKKEQSLVYLVGLTKPELGASEYFRMLKIKEGFVPEVDKTIALNIFNAVTKSIGRNLVLSCHDLSEGGLAVALAEMSCGSGLGACVFLDEVAKQGSMKDYELLFSESPTRFIVEVEKKNKDAFESLFEALPFGLIGCVSGFPQLVITGTDSKEIVNVSIDGLRKSWMKTFQEFR
ncbi:MAG: phosphoribosylformylglycinamidine synthase subunit PurL [Candidatus Omnitrophica bacterium]|nr:phosphoribosylformylglycinamidine synthase subunit PurL [Candidatus Omnitrophota bacterium]